MAGAARLRAFLKLGRPHFLVGGLLLFALGSVLARAQGIGINWQRYVWGQATITAAQWMTHYSNDYFDLAADRANSTPTRWSGGSRVLVNGTVTPHAALVASAVLGTTALIAACILAARPDSPRLVLPLALLIIVLSWCYSAPPLRLLSRGLGEATTAFVVTLLTPLLGFYVQSGALRPQLFLACFPLCCLQFSMLLTIELPDAAGDAALGKRTLVVRRGAEWAARCSAAILVATFASLPMLFLLGLPARIAIFAALPAPLGLWQATRLTRGAFRASKHWESLALCSVALLATTTLAELTGAVLTAVALH
ncbi:MAG TPA: prenyltransferase [Polyangiaceae bacterium]|jgi:1,4-dihydroxy-2-naphthoate octaprenyltransferase|nr:prenyltransferase [Polyangiaceae bacterium]